MIEIVPSTKPVPNDEDLVTPDEIITLLESNRMRIRILGSMVLTVCGLLISTSLVILFFILKELSAKTPMAIPILLFSVIGCLTISIISGVISAYLPTPTAVCTRLELIDLLTRIYRSEYRRVTISVAFLLLGVLLFSMCLAFFALTSL